MQTYTAEEARKEIWRDLMKARKIGRRDEDSRYSWLPLAPLPDITLKLDRWLTSVGGSMLYDEFVQSYSNSLHISQLKLGCQSDAFLKYKIICWHRLTPDKFIRSEHIPYAKDSVCRGNYD